MNKILQWIISSVLFRVQLFHWAWQEKILFQASARIFIKICGWENRSLIKSHMHIVQYSKSESYAGSFFSMIFSLKAYKYNVEIKFNQICKLQNYVVSGTIWLNGPYVDHIVPPGLNREQYNFWYQMKAHIFLIANPKFQLQFFAVLEI